MPQSATSYIPTAAATRTRNADVLYFPFAGRPQAMTVYARFIMQHVQPTVAVAGTSIRCWQISASGARFLAYFDSAAGGFGVSHVNTQGTTKTVTVIQTAAVGAQVELVAWLYSDGSVNLTVSVNGATATTGTQSSASALSPAWGTNVLYLGSANGASGFAVLPLRDVLIARGNQTLATMRKRAGQ